MPARTRQAAMAALLGASLVACGQRAAPRPQGEAPLRTTDGAIAVNNLNSNIEAVQRYLSRPGTKNPVREGDLASLFGTRAKYLGMLGDLDRALELATKASAAAPKNGSLHLGRAAALAALHLFDAAQVELDAAARLGESGSSSEALLGSIVQARGDIDEAIVLRRKAVAGHATIDTLGGLAAAHAARRDLALAEKTFAQALAVYRDTAPFPVAWIDFQRGLMLEREGRLDEARARYQAAVERLPAYAQAASHLAAIEALQGHRERAEALLRPLLWSSDDPEYVGQLAALRRDAGDVAEATSLHARASAAYDLLLARHPDAFADHAARFFLQANPSKALGLARRNLALRKTWEAYDLALTAALAASDLTAGCELSAQALARPSPPRRIELLAARASKNCAKKSGTITAAAAD